MPPNQINSVDMMMIDHDTTSSPPPPMTTMMTTHTINAVVAQQQQQRSNDVHVDTSSSNNNNNSSSNTMNTKPILRCAILGCGMMGQEHISYIMGYPNELRIDYLCDPHVPSLNKSLQVMEQFRTHTMMTTTTTTTTTTHDGVEDEEEEDEKKMNEDDVDKDNKNSKSTLASSALPQPLLLMNEESLLQYAHEIDVLVIATPNYCHTDQLERWSPYNVTILLEKPVAVSVQQHEKLSNLYSNYGTSTSLVSTKEQQEDTNNNNNIVPTSVPSPLIQSRVWVAMEYRFIPAVAKLISLLPTIGDIKMVTIRENRYPFLHKIDAWNRDRTKTGDTLVEKCCHFFDLMRLITGQEAQLDQIRSMVQRGLNYEDEPSVYDVPIIDSAYVFMPFHSRTNHDSNTTTSEQKKVKTMGCLELCMYAEGSRHQEEIIVTGTKGRLEAYLPENKVYAFERPSKEEWVDRSVPPNRGTIRQTVYDCSNVYDVHGIDMNTSIPTHGGYHYSSTAVEWYQLLQAIRSYEQTGIWNPMVSLMDGLRAVEIGLCATQAIVNEQQQQQQQQDKEQPLLITNKFGSYLHPTTTMTA